LVEVDLWVDSDIVDNGAGKGCILEKKGHRFVILRPLELTSKHSLGVGIDGNACKSMFSVRKVDYHGLLDG